MFPNLQHCKKEISSLIKKRHSDKHGSLGGLGWKEEKEVLQFVAISFGGYQIWEPKDFSSLQSMCTPKPNQMHFPIRTKDNFRPCKLCYQLS
jgi:hypothetical protein